MIVVQFMDCTSKHKKTQLTCNAEYTLRKCVYFIYQYLLCSLVYIIQCDVLYIKCCDTDCNEGFYGENCSFSCGHCRNQEQCDVINGSCFNGCENGYWGFQCNYGIIIDFDLNNMLCWQYLRNLTAFSRTKS